MAGALAMAWRLAGRPAALVALVLLLFGLPAFTQFKPGRIDHHNVQIALAVLTVAATAWSDRKRWTAGAAGALSGLALVIGQEGLPFAVCAGGILVVRYTLDRTAAAALAAYGMAVAASALIGFFISVAPAHWTQPACDAIAINFVVPVAAGGLGLSVVARSFNATGPLIRFFAAMTVAGLAAAAFILLEPRCLGGPMAMVNPAVRPIWYDHVYEMLSLSGLARDYFGTSLAISAFPVAALIAAILLAFDVNLRRDFGFITGVIALLVAAAMMVLVIRGAPYATWLGLPFVAAALLRLFSLLKLTTVPMKIAMTVPFTPAFLTFGMFALADVIHPAEVSAVTPDAPSCLDIADYAPLARLPAGNVVTDTGFTQHMLALTPHSVVASPYHRLADAIIANHRALSLSPEAAEKIFRDTRASYLILCDLRVPTVLSDSERVQGLWGRLQAGSIPSWLQRMPDAGPFRVYRVVP
jgi:hypothetical protein